MRNCTNTLYVDTELLEELNVISDLGVTINRSVTYPDVMESIISLNALALKEKMYPENKFLPLSFCSSDELTCVIVGGMPDLSRIEQWTGSAYSYTESDSYPNILHEKMLDDTSFVSARWKRVEYDPSNDELQKAGVLLLHDVLSVTKNYANECRKMWRPIISRLLYFISTERPDVPIVFTSALSYATFNKCCVDSKNIFTLKLNSEKMRFHDSPKVFKFIEDLVNKDKEPSKKISFSDLIEQYA